MMHLTVHEWGGVCVGTENSIAPPHAFTRTQANALLAAARMHPLANQHGTNILIDRHSKMIARQMVGVIAAPGCSLEILPKIDNERIESDDTIRRRLIRMLDVALGLKLGNGQAATMARQAENLLDILIRLFSERLLAEVQRGLPCTYLAQEDDLPALRGRLNIKRQFTTHAVRPERLACRYDVLSVDTPLLRIMKACVALLRHYARAADTLRRLNELRSLLVDVSDVPLSHLPWSQARIDRTNHRWETLYNLARLLLKRDWQATHHDSQAQHGITLLFPMNDLFEAYIAALTRRAVRDTEWTVRAQAGRLYCLSEDGKEGKQRFQTRPDLIIERDHKTVMIIDTKWKRIVRHPEDTKNGVSQADVYQMMAYSRLYYCPQVMLLYPHHAGLGAQPMNVGYRILAGEERLQVASVDLIPDDAAIVEQLIHLIAINTQGE
ncbi:McrC family protein [Pectobacterium zantedeschiae]|uniref:McrC family protein n=1 Tax=Pectobacterium zantedeschiae TaxID=2034769 RepID=UPI00101D6E25|nr:McrC family protein [Pectobacterium zantedeschiae]RYC47903.1 calmodulin-binding protein [Pectobacterium zantedeschiae]